MYMVFWMGEVLLLIWPKSGGGDIAPHIAQLSPPIRRAWSYYIDVPIFFMRYHMTFWGHKAKFI